MKRLWCPKKYHGWPRITGGEYQHTSNRTKEMMGTNFGVRDGRESRWQNTVT